MTLIYVIKHNYVWIWSWTGYKSDTTCVDWDKKCPAIKGDVTLKIYETVFENNWIKTIPDYTVHVDGLIVKQAKYLPIIPELSLEIKIIEAQREGER